MAPQETALYESVQGQLDANGGVSIRIGPSRYGEKWRVTRMTTTGTGLLIPKLYVYRGNASPSNQIDSSYNGNNDTSETNIALNTTDFLTFVYINGSAGAFNGVNVEGVRTYGI